MVKDWVIITHEYFCPSLSAIRIVDLGSKPHHGKESPFPRPFSRRTLPSTRGMLLEYYALLAGTMAEQCRQHENTVMRIATS